MRHLLFGQLLRRFARGNRCGWRGAAVGQQPITAKALLGLIDQQQIPTCGQIDRLVDDPLHCVYLPGRALFGNFGGIVQRLLLCSSRIFGGLHGGVARHQKNLQALLLGLVVLLDRILVLVKQVGLSGDGFGLGLLRRVGAHLDGGVCRLSCRVGAYEVASLGQLLNVLIPRLRAGAIGFAGGVLRCCQLAVIGRQVLRVLVDGLQAIGIAVSRLNVGVIACRNPLQRGLE
ncbi:hypothetical protein D3C86_1039720 [compost metagenome]